ncbi:hypothetical protein AGMMS49959_04780 [Planctomycetales bacterium]|nr:hypothetical protein AGMMS49959_04780 [Planctomycetales bacterium]
MEENNLETQEDVKAGEKEAIDANALLASGVAIVGAIVGYVALRLLVSHELVTDGWWIWLAFLVIGAFVGGFAFGLVISGCGGDLAVICCVAALGAAAGYGALTLLGKDGLVNGRLAWFAFVAGGGAVSFVGYSAYRALHAMIEHYKKMVDHYQRFVNYNLQTYEVYKQTAGDVAGDNGDDFRIECSGWVIYIGIVVLAFIALAGYGVYCILA